MKKYAVILMLMLFVSSILITGCGPKQASEQTLAELEELREAADQAEAEAKECAMKTQDYEEKIADLEEEIENLKNEIKKYK